MRGWGLGERLDLLCDNGDSDNDLDSDEEWTWGIVKWMGGASGEPQEPLRKSLVGRKGSDISPWTGSKRTMAKAQCGHSGWSAASWGVLEVQGRPFRIVFLPRFKDAPDQDKCE